MKSKIILISILLIASFLRLWKLGDVAPSMFGDELDVGYHAYSIVKTGRDYYGNFMPLQFHSLAEWRTPLYLYSTVFTVALFGISPWGVRLPAALFGILGVWGLYLLTKELTKSNTLALVAAFLLALSPWHIQYSRAGFEVTELLAFFLFGLYFFFRSLREKGQWFWISLLLLVSTPWVYSTAKFFTPLLLVFLAFVFRKSIFALPKKNLLTGLIVALIIGLPLVYTTIWGGGTQRFNYISVFSDPTIEPEVGTGRTQDALTRGELTLGIHPTFIDKLFHNKVIFWADEISSNYLESFSTEFLFNEGDPNLRHSIKGIGQFYKIEFLALLLGIIFFFANPHVIASETKQSLKIKFLIAFWIFAGAIPSSITQDGGNHATRLILILPPLIFLMAYGLVSAYYLLPKIYRLLLTLCYMLLFSLNFIFYQHTYWVHNPSDSERFWHSGWRESIRAIKEIDGNYDRVIITMSDEPSWIPFAAWYEYDPSKWQHEFPIGNDEEVKGWGKIAHTGKFYFGSFHPEKGGLYDLSKYIDKKTLYLASAKEIGANLIAEPGRTPSDLQLIKAIAYPSGEPVFYLFTKAN